MSENKSEDQLESIRRLGASALSRVIAAAFPFLSYNLDLEEFIYDVIKVSAEKLVRQRIGATPKQVQADFQNRAEAATQHLSLAGSILDELNADLARQNQELNTIQKEIESRKKDVAYWGELARVQKETAEVLVIELERTVRGQIRQELERGKRVRMFMAFIGWVITLILGGIVGAAIQNYWQTGKFF